MDQPHDSDLTPPCPPPTLAELRKQHRWEPGRQAAVLPTIPGRTERPGSFWTWSRIWLASVVATALLVSLDLHAPAMGGHIGLLALFGWTVPLCFLDKWLRYPPTTSQSQSGAYGHIRPFPHSHWLKYSTGL